MNSKMKRKKENEPHVQFHYVEFVVMLVPFADVFGLPKEMNLTFQGCDVTVSDVQDELAGLFARMEAWQTQIKQVPQHRFLSWMST